MVPSWHPSHFRTPSSSSAAGSEVTGGGGGGTMQQDDVRSEAHRQELLNGVLGAVKRCQVRFGGRKSELATEENEPAVRDLCRGLERVFQHGVVVSQGGGSAFVVGDIIPKLASSGGGASPSYAASSFWPFLKRHLGKSDLDRFLLLSNVNTDLGRCRAWLRAAVNEHTLERYVHAVLSDADRGKFYEPFAFLNDGERSSMLAPMSAGIGSIHFAIKVDVPGLNRIAAEEENNKDSDLIAKTSTAQRASEEEAPPATATSQTKKKRRVPSQFVSFDGDDVTSRPISPSSSSSSTRTPKNHQTLEKQILLNQTSSKTMASRARARGSAASEDASSTNAEQRRSATPTRLSFDRVELAGEGGAHSGSQKQRLTTATGESEDEDVIDIYSKSPTGSRKSEVSLDEGGLSVAGSSTSGNRLTPMKNVNVGQLIPLFSSNSVSGGDAASDLNNCDFNSEDSVSMRSFGEESDYATFGRHVSANSEPSHGEKGQKVEISRHELKQALLSVMARKEELQRQLAQMKKLLEQETRSAASLKEEVAESKRRAREESERQEGRVGTLGRENELLKHQLKKYVGAVQKLRDGPQAYETLAQLDKVEERQERERNYVDYHYEASEYEKKLIHLAEMHGELIEFNEHLRRASIAKDGVIAKMRAELEELRGPLPVDEEQDQADAAAATDNADAVSLASSSAIGVPSATRALIHLWIPSVFLSGNGSKTHHVYQVYLRIRDEEWNIYRRYSDFYALHNDLRKKESLVDSFYFPPKKSVGYKTEKVVEERRKRLQSYLRQVDAKLYTQMDSDIDQLGCFQVVNLLVQTNPALAARPNKGNVLLLMPFFAENYVMAKAAAAVAGRDRARSQSRGRSIFSRRKTSTAATATTAGGAGSGPQLAL